MSKTSPTHDESTFGFATELGVSRSGRKIWLERTLLEGGAGSPRRARYLEIPEEAIRGNLWREPAVPDIREAVAVGVCTVLMGRPGQIRAHTIWRRESRPFANQNQAATDPKAGTNWIADADSPLLNHREWSYGPGVGEQLRQQMGEHRDGIALNGESRESVGDDNGQVAGGWAKQGNGVGMNSAAQIRLTKISGAIRRVTSQLENLN